MGQVFGWAEPYPYKQVGKKVRQDLYALLVEFASLVEFATLLRNHAIGWRLSRDYGHPQTGTQTARQLATTHLAGTERLQ